MEEKSNAISNFDCNVWVEVTAKLQSVRNYQVDALLLKTLVVSRYNPKTLTEKTALDRYNVSAVTQASQA